MSCLSAFMCRAFGSGVLVAAVLAPATVLAQQDAARWSEIGPFSTGGRVSAIAIDPQNPQHVLVGTPAGAIWKSLDGGHSWSITAPWLAAVPISALAIDASNADVILAGTGAITDAGAVTPGVGLLLSSDGGQTWSTQATGGTSAPYIAQVLVWPGVSQRVLVATDMGVQVSTDGGAHLQLVLSGDAISQIALDPFSAGGAYAVGRGGLYYSADQGQTWTRRAAWPLAATDVFGAGTTAIAVSRRTSGLLYAAVQVLKDLNGTDRGILLRSVDGGATFTQIPSAPAFCPQTTSCGFGLALALDPSSDSRLLLAADKIDATADAGLTWRTVAADVPRVHQLVAQGTGLLVAGATGVHAIDSTWGVVTAQNSGLAVTGILDLDASNDSPPRLLASTADTGTLVGSNASWQSLFAPTQPAGTARWDRFVATRIYVGRPGGFFFRSDDNGTTFTAIQSGLDMTQSAFEPAPLEPSPLVAGLLFTGRLQLFQSAAAGNAWTTMRPPGFPEISRIAASPVDSNRVYFALADRSDIYKADEINTQLQHPTTEPNLRVTSIFLDPAAENIVYVTMSNSADQSGRIFKSWDFGNTWQDVTPPAFPSANSIVKDAFGALYAGTSSGVWRSPNDGVLWSRFNVNLLAGGVNVLRIGGGNLYAGTNGRGVFSWAIRPLVQIDTIPPGLNIVVDGVTVSAPYYAVWEAGSVHEVAAALSNTDSTQETFVSWSDGGTTDHQTTSTGTNQFLTLAVQQSHRLVTLANPVAGGTYRAEPASGDGFYVLGTFVTTVAEPAPDYRLTGFSGDQSGADGVLAFALMDKPRGITANFAPLRTQLSTDPPGLTVNVDGTPVVTPATYQWPVGNQHTVTAPELVDSDPTTPDQLAFDAWSDLLPRQHNLISRRDTFVTDLTARFIRTYVTLPLGALRATVARTSCASDAPRAGALTLAPGAGQAAPASLQIARSRIEGKYIHEFALVPAAATTQLDVVVESTPTRPVRLAVYNPGSASVSVSLVLRSSAGIGLLALADALNVAPGAQVVRMLSDFAVLPASFEGMLSLLATQPVVASIQVAGVNLRPSTFLDPVAVVPFTTADAGYGSSLVQALVLTPDTVHRISLLNPGPTSLAGSIVLRDADGHALEGTDGSQTSSTFSYAIPAGGYRTFHLTFASALTGPTVTAQVRVVPSSGQSAPLVQSSEDRQAGTASDGSPILIPRSLPPARGSRHFQAPVDLATRDSGFIVTNPTSASAVVKVRVLNPGDVVVASANVSIPPLGQRLVMARGLFPGVSGTFVGLLDGSTSANVLATGLFRSVSDNSDDIIAGFPALNGDASTSGAPLTYAYAIDGDSYTSEWWLVNRTTSSTQVTFTFQGEDGLRRYFPFQQ